MTTNKVLARATKANADSQVRAGRLAEAHDLYESVATADRRDVEAWVKLGDVRRQLGRYPDAEFASREAVRIAPGLGLAHQTLGAALQCQGKAREAVAAYRKAVQFSPRHPDAHYLLGNALIDVGLMSEAAACCSRAVDLRPDFFEALSDLGSALLALGRREDAAEILGRARALRPDSPVALANTATLLELEGHAEEALRQLRRARDADPGSVDLVAKHAELLERIGRTHEAASIVADASRVNRRHPLLNLVAARLARRDSRYEDAVALLEGALDQPMRHDLAGEIRLMLGQLHDRLGNFDRVFPLLLDGKRRVAMATHSGGTDAQRYLERIESACAWLGAGTPTPGGARPDPAMSTPAFLLGFPRSGTTLLEQILDGHPRIQTLSEQPMSAAMERTYLKITGGEAGALARLDDGQIEELRRAYFAQVARCVERTPGTLLIDKLPLNTIRAPLLWRVFPDARFIFAARHPCDVCLSCLMQNFAANEAMNSLGSLESIVTVYARVISAWQQTVRRLPTLRFQRIRYEDLVDNVEREARALLQFLGLEWHDSVLQHARRAQQRGIMTPSYHQVTQAIYRHARFRWRHYADEFTPVMSMLQPCIDSLGYAEQDCGPVAPGLISMSDCTAADNEADRQRAKAQAASDAPR